MTGIFLRRLAGATCCALLLAQGAWAQSRSLIPTIDPEKKFMQLRDAANRPCVTIKGAVRSGIVNPSEISHILVAENDCVMRISIEACYYETTRCVDFDLGSYDKKEVLLGIMNNMGFFRFDYTEKEIF